MILSFDIFIVFLLNLLIFLLGKNVSVFVHDSPRSFVPGIVLTVCLKFVFVSVVDWFLIYSLCWILLCFFMCFEFLVLIFLDSDTKIICLIFCAWYFRSLVPGVVVSVRGSLMAVYRIDFWFLYYVAYYYMLWWFFHITSIFQVFLLNFLIFWDEKKNIFNFSCTTVQGFITSFEGAPVFPTGWKLLKKSDNKW